VSLQGVNKYLFNKLYHFSNWLLFSPCMSSHCSASEVDFSKKALALLFSRPYSSVPSSLSVDLFGPKQTKALQHLCPFQCAEILTWFSKEATHISVSHGRERSRGMVSHDFSCGNVKPISVPALLACKSGITVLSDYGSLDDCVYFWDGFKGQSHAQQFACVISIPSNTQHRLISNL